MDTSPSFAPPAGDDPAAWVEPVLAAGLALAAPGSNAPITLVCPDQCVLRAGARTVLVRRPHTPADRADIAHLAASLLVDGVEEELWTPRRAAPPTAPPPTKVVVAKSTRTARAQPKAPPAPPAAPPPTEAVNTALDTGAATAAPPPTPEAPPIDPDELRLDPAVADPERAPAGSILWARVGGGGTWDAGATTLGGAAEAAFGVGAGPFDLGLAVGGRVSTLPDDVRFEAVEVGAVVERSWPGPWQPTAGLGVAASFRQYEILAQPAQGGIMAVASLRAGLETPAGPLTVGPSLRVGIDLGRVYVSRKDGVVDAPIARAELGLVLRYRENP